MADNSEAFAFGNAELTTMLKTYYAKNGVENLLYRNDPFLKKIGKEQVAGKTANFSAMYSRGGGVAANYISMKNYVLNGAKAKEFAVTPGQVFSGCIFNSKEILASGSLRGAYINIAQAKFFAALESFRKTLAVALYGSGYGELCKVPTAVETATTDISLTLPQHAVMALDIGSKVEFRTSLTTTTNNERVATVKSIVGTTVKFTADSSITLATTDYICLAGCHNGSDPLLPVGLAGWIPLTDPVANSSFFGVDRSDSRDRLAGMHYKPDTATALYKTIQEGILRLRRMGSLCDVIVMNDEDYAKMAAELETKTNFQKVDGGKAKGKAVVGYQDFGFSMSTNWLDNVIDSPYCPSGIAYILSSDTVKLWTFSNTGKIADGIVDNEPGKPDVNSDDPSQLPYKLLVDNLISIQPGEESMDGPATLASINFYGSFVVTNPSVNGVVEFNYPSA